MPEMTLSEVTKTWLAHMANQGKSPRTLYTYGKDCEQILAFFGSHKKLSKLLPAHVARFYKSNALLMIPKSGKERAVTTVEKTKRVLRLLLEWAKTTGQLHLVPLPKETKERP